MAEKTTRVSVPKELANDDGEIVVRWDGDDPTKYKVNDGHVAVENSNVERFLAHFDGTKVDAASASNK